MRVLGYFSELFLSFQLMFWNALSCFPPPSASNPCEKNDGRGPCSHLCLINYNRTASCTCPHLMKLSPNKQSCFGRPETTSLFLPLSRVKPVNVRPLHPPTPFPPAAVKRFLLYVRRSEIRGVDIEDPYMNIMTALTVPDIDDVTVVDYDALEERIYWADIKTQAIKRAFINGTQLETIISAGVCSPGKVGRDGSATLKTAACSRCVHRVILTTRRAGLLTYFYLHGFIFFLFLSFSLPRLTDIVNCRSLALDWLSRNLYWLSSENDESQINVARFDGSLKTSIIHGIDKPRCLVVHPARG